VSLDDVPVSGAKINMAIPKKINHKEAKLFTSDEGKKAVCMNGFCVFKLQLLS
jgi:hypothetical protein